MPSGEDNDVVIFPETYHHVAAAAEANAIIVSTPVQTSGVDTAVDEVRLIDVINYDDDNDYDDDGTK